MGWSERIGNLASLAGRQLFFIGGAPRSGTTWVQQLFDAHPEVSCHGEALFSQELAKPLEQLMLARRKALEAKNKELFRHTGGWPLPEADEVEVLLGTAILLEMERSAAGGNWRAVGEKTPENVFLYPRLRGLFPEAKFIGVARDPRDMLASAWRMFREGKPGFEQTEAAKQGFAEGALGVIGNGLRGLIAMERQDGAHCTNVTYEALIRTPEAEVARLYGFLGVTVTDELVADCVARCSFEALSGRKRGQAAEGAFLRKGVVGDWPATFPPAVGASVVLHLGWAYSHFGWQE